MKLSRIVLQNLCTTGPKSDVWTLIEVWRDHDSENVIVVFEALLYYLFTIFPPRSYWDTVLYLISQLVSSCFIIEYLRLGVFQSIVNSLLFWSFVIRAVDYSRPRRFPIRLLVNFNYGREVEEIGEQRETFDQREDEIVLGRDQIVNETLD